MILLISVMAVKTFPSLSVMLVSLLTDWRVAAWLLGHAVVGGSGGGSFFVEGSAIDQQPSSPTDYHLVWSDDFDGHTLDKRKWYPLIDCSGRGNNELQCYTSRSDNVRVRNGRLELMAAAENYAGRNFTSGRVHAVGPGWTYGWFEARVRLPRGMHLWPAVWLVPTNNAYGPWPRSGEIDVMEARGQNVFQFESTVHFGSSRSDRGKVGSSMIDFPFDLSQDFHVFGFEWTNQSMRWFLDGVQYFETSTNRFFTDKKGERIYSKKGSPFDQNFKWILNVAVGGFYFPYSVYGRISRADALVWPKPVMEVDWVRVFQKKTPSSRHQPQPSPTPKPSPSPTTAPQHQQQSPPRASRPGNPSGAAAGTPAPVPAAAPSVSPTSSPSSTSVEPSTAAAAAAEAAAETTTVSAPSVLVTSATASPSPATIASQVQDEEEEQEADKKNKDEGTVVVASEKRQASGTKSESEMLNEKKMNEVVSDADNNADRAYDDVVVSAADQRGNPLNHYYYDYY